MAKQVSQKKVVSRKGLILIVFGVFSMFEISTLLGLISLVLGLFIYFIFILIERKLKLF
jgi:hypothetical protein